MSKQEEAFRAIRDIQESPFGKLYPHILAGIREKMAVGLPMECQTTQLYATTKPY